jgi:hypothetical protein
MRTKRHISVLSICVMLTSLSGCVNYPAVSTLSSAMRTNIATWTPFVEDYGTTCTRLVALQTADDSDGTTCEKLKAQGQQVGAAIKILDNYFGALGAVATGSDFTFDEGLGEIGDQGRKLGADPARVTAIQTLASALADLAVSGLRAKAMGKLIAQAGNARDTVLAIQEVFDTTYRSNLKREAEKWQEAMQKASYGLGMGDPPACSATIVWQNSPPAASSAPQLQFQQFYEAQCAKIVARQNALDGFDASARELTASLNKLASPDIKLKDSAVAKALLTQAKTLVEDAKAIKNAFKTS